MIGDSRSEISVGDGSVCNMNVIRVESAEVGAKIYGTLAGRDESESGDDARLSTSINWRKGPCNMGMRTEAAKNWRS